MSLGISFRTSAASVLLTGVTVAATAGPVAEPVSPGPRSRRTERLLESFDVERALDLAAVADLTTRSPGSAGYDAVLVEFERALRQVGFGSVPGFQLDALEVPLAAPSWNGRAARVVLIENGRELLLHSFDEPSARDRAILPRNAPGTPTEGIAGPAVFELDDVGPGTVLVTQARVRPDLLRRAASRGASAVVSASLATFNLRHGSDDHRDAIQVRELAPGSPLPVFQISPDSYALLRASRAPRLALQAEVEYGAPVARVLVASIDGALRPGEAVVLTAHLQGFGASDDAGGAAGLLEAALTAADLVATNRLARPERSLVFVFGPEMLQAERWLATSSIRPVAAIGVLGIGSGDGRLVLERGPDPGVGCVPSECGLDDASHDAGALCLPGPGTLPVRPNALAALARNALADVADAIEAMAFEEVAYEGGASPDPFLRTGVPAVLFWSRPGASSRTSLDRFETLDAEALRGGAVAALATAWSLADPSTEDLARTAVGLEAERFLRVEQALGRGRGDLALSWMRWIDQAGSWLREQER